MTSFKSNIYNLTVESLNFLKVFQTIGFLPIKLVHNDRFNFYISSILLMVITIVITALRFMYPINNIMMTALFLWNINTILFGMIVNVVTIKRQKCVMKLFGEIDSKAIKLKSLWNQLKKGNVKFHQQLVVTWMFFLTFTLYGPISKAVNSDYSEQFYDSLYHIIPFVLVHIQLTKILYLYGLLALKLDLIKMCVENITIHGETLENNCLIGEIMREKIVKNITSNNNLMVLKEMYRNCWMLQNEINAISNFFFVLYMIGYVGQICYVIIYYIKTALKTQQLFLMIIGKFLYNSFSMWF